MIGITYDEVIDINRDLILTYSPAEQIGVKDAGLLDLSLNKIYSGFGDFELYPTTITKIVGLYTAIERNHCFYNANKRTSTYVLLILLDRNDYVLDMTEDEIIDMCLNYVNKESSDEDVLELIETRAIDIA